MEMLNDAALIKVASYFKALSEPTRLKLLNAMRDGSKTVSELKELTGCSQANTSKHLAMLLEAGLVSRLQKGNQAIYSIADECTYELCDIVCGNVAKILQRDAVISAALQGINPNS